MLTATLPISVALLATTTIRLLFLLPRGCRARQEA
jgi:hypothetical protein